MSGVRSQDRHEAEGGKRESARQIGGSMNDEPRMTIYEIRSTMSDILYASSEKGEVKSMNSDGDNKSLLKNKWMIFYLVLLFIVIAAGWFATGYLGDKAKEEILEYNDNIVSSHSDHLISEFEKVERGVKALSGSP
ncbi:MAG: hypothetical protein KKH97_06745 [Proteobacteria bacterium]|nr:hypothetical protein [Pseudomonadota bacterium]